MKQELQYKEKGVETLQEWVTCMCTWEHFLVISFFSDTFHTWTCYVQKSQYFNFYAFIYAHYFLISNIRIFLFLEDTLFLQMEVLGKQNPFYSYAYFLNRGTA